MNKKTDRRLDLTSPQSRKALTKMVLKLFDYWSLDPEDHLRLLGYKPASKSTLERLRGGVSIPPGKDKLTRIGKLLSIHNALCIILPQDRDLCYSWVKRRNKAFEDKTPIEIMIDGIEGLDRVCRYLEQHLGR
jgi:uncharacterized protein (DUF2384 family)